MFSFAPLLPPPPPPPPPLVRATMRPFAAANSDSRDARALREVDASSEDAASASRARAIADLPDALAIASACLERESSR